MQLSCAHACILIKHNWKCEAFETHNFLDLSVEMQQSVALSKSNLFQKNICLHDKTLASLDAAVQSDILIIFNQRRGWGVC